MPDTKGASSSTAPTIIVAPDGSVHLRVHATTLHLDAAEYLELVRKALDALPAVTRLVRQARARGELQ
jgi:hypothetical protein